MTEDTLPPVPPAPKWKRLLSGCWSWLCAHPVVFAAGGGLLTGLLAPTVARWLF